MPSVAPIPDFDDEPTVVDLHPVAAPVPEPPALPFTLLRRKEARDDAWLDELSPAARRVLERAALPAPIWPVAPRVLGAVALPAEA